jgi:LacI family transcriptional regulator
VSATTASFVLSGRRDMRISAATEERVLQAARFLDYRRRLEPRGPLPAGAPVIGIVSDVVATEAFAGEMLRGAIAAAADQGHVLLLTDSEGVGDLETSAVTTLLSRGVGKFVLATMATSSRPVPEGLRDQRLVLANTVDPTLDVPAVLPDEETAGRTAVETLLLAGHTTGILIVGDISSRVVASRLRMNGITAALTEAGLRLGGHIKCGWWPDETRAAIKERLESGWWDRRRPTAVITMNDRAAMGVYQALAAGGRTIPGDLSVISFDNSDLARWLDPALTSLDLPYFDLGRRAVELLLDESAAAGVQRLPMTLRARGSVGPPARNVRRAAGRPALRQS